MVIGNLKNYKMLLLNKVQLKNNQIVKIKSRKKLTYNRKNIKTSFKIQQITQIIYSKTTNYFIVLIFLPVINTTHKRQTLKNILTLNKKSKTPSINRQLNCLRIYNK